MARSAGSAALAAGAIVALYFWENGGWCVPGGSRQFLLWADQIVRGGSLDPSIAQRDVGYPLLLVLSGWPWTRSLIPIVAIQTVMAALMPLLAYLCLARFSRPLALATALAVVFSGGPVYYAKMIHHDQAYIFWVLATAAAIILFIATQRIRHLYLFTAACLLATLTRPAGMLLFPALLGLAWLMSGYHRQLHVVACGLLFAGAMIGYQTYRHQLFGDASYTGAQLFYNPYLNARDYHVALDPHAGPNLALLDGELSVALANPKFLADHVGAEPPTVAAQLFDGVSPQRVWAEPNWEYFMLLADAARSDHVLLGAAIELMQAHPGMVARYAVRNTLLFLFDPGWQHSRQNTLPLNYGGLDFLPALNGPPDQYEAAVLGPTVAELTPARIPAPLVILWKAAIKIGVPLGALLTVAAWLLIGLTRSYPRHFVAAFAVVTLLILYEAAVSGIFAEPSYRYANFVLTLRVLAAGFAVLAIFGRKRLCSSSP